VISYLQDFLFSPDRCRTPVKILSGGERNRLMLAKLFIQPANVLVLDEPTNDLDMETLELLEELLWKFSGTVLLVSHDRFFLNHVVTSTLAFEGRGRIVEYPGGYDDWLTQRPQQETNTTQKAIKAPKDKPGELNNRPPKKPKKLGYMQARELEQLPEKIEALEAEQHEILTALADPAFYKQAKKKITAMHHRLGEVEAAIAAAYARWEELE
jgi:ATP-binding cassette subfamily F protein uup